MKTKVAIFVLVVAVVVTDRQLSGQAPEDSKPAVPVVELPKPESEPLRLTTPAPPSAPADRPSPPASSSTLGWNTPATAPAESQKNADLLTELIAVLNTTKSSDTFVVTLELIRDMGPKAERAIPAIIRNGERLGWLKDEQVSEEGNPDKGEFILGVLRAIHGARKDKPVRTPVGACCGALIPTTDNPVRVPVGAPTSN